MEEENYSTFVCQSCKGPTEPTRHTCPFKEDVMGDYETKCNCCYFCEQNCCDEI